MLCLMKAKASNNSILNSSKLIIIEEELHLWYRHLAINCKQTESIKLLSEDEIERAEQITNAQSRMTFIESRSTLRNILAMYLDKDPKSLRLEKSLNGKPHLKGKSHLCFNIAHTNGIALFAISNGAEVGVDVERIDRRIDSDAIAKRFFSIREQNILKKLSVKKKQKYFFECWTCKEAVVKAMDKKVIYHLSEIELSENKDSIMIKDNPDAEHWRIWFPKLPNGFIGAVVRKKGQFNTNVSRI
ncbi:MAG: hypothetical protein COS94_01480 [Candidatus Hydrogenedentes bacterium CG07_land_8_20_14_0_80_42_17]|nr:MAG: hypothetical protein COS94_01480 [Candidatus Hydrogenedentes bacterium CG07_land_8_20_14_0_80_42_17]